MEYAKDAGKSTGVVTTSQITDATGAAFGAHVEDRSKQSDIALQLLTKSKVDVLLGGVRISGTLQAIPGNSQMNPLKILQRKAKEHKVTLLIKLNNWATPM